MVILVDSLIAEITTVDAKRTFHHSECIKVTYRKGWSTKLKWWAVGKDPSINNWDLKRCFTKKKDLSWNHHFSGSIFFWWFFRLYLAPEVQIILHIWNLTKNRYQKMIDLWIWHHMWKNFCWGRSFESSEYQEGWTAEKILLMVEDLVDLLSFLGGFGEQNEFVLYLQNGGNGSSFV